MGIYDRDYDRDEPRGFGGGGFGGGGWEPRAPASANGKLLLAIGAAYLAQLVFGEGFTDLFALRSDWLAEPWRFFSLATYGLLHSTANIGHVLFNALAIFFFGRAIEARYGGREYVTFFFAAVVVAGLTWWAAEAIAGGQAVVMGPDGVARAVPAPTTTLVGASGGIAGVLLLFALLYPHVQVYLMGVLPVPAWAMAALFVGQDVLGAVGRSGNVAYTAHLGGALFGYLYFRNRWRLSDLLPAWLGGAGGGASTGATLPGWLKRRPSLRVLREEDDGDDRGDPAEERVDQILRKIQAQGQASLTREERRVLEQASRRYQRRQS